MGPREAWHPLCRSSRLGVRPLVVELQGRPIVLFREANGRPAALLDRCPHRNAPLSAGRVRSDGIECGYHGWTFDGSGRCLRIPGLDGEADAKGRRAEALATRESDGLIFAWGVPGAEPEGEPFASELEEASRYTKIDYEFAMESSLHAALENILDVPHTAYLHGGLFRRKDVSNEITALVRRGRDRVEAEFLGEPRPSGLAGRVFAPGGGVVKHFDRFVLPSTAQVEYGIGEDAHLVTTSHLLAESPTRTRLFSTIRYRTRLPGFLLLPVFAPIAWFILRQDAVMLKKLTDTVERFGGERHSSTELDLLGGTIAQLLRDGPADTDPDDERRVTFRA